jgi:hypothetical protein
LLSLKIHVENRRGLKASYMVHIVMVIAASHSFDVDHGASPPCSSMNEKEVLDCSRPMTMAIGCIWLLGGGGVVDSLRL